jgi:hypothetical protein
MLINLSGDESVIVNICDNWVEYLIAYLLLLQPQTMKDDVPNLVNYCMQAIKQRNGLEGVEDSESSALSLCRAAILQYDIYNAIQLSNQLLDLRWFNAHLIDLLHKAKALHNNATEIRDYYLIQYIHTLATTSKNNLYELLFDYCGAVSDEKSRYTLLHHYLLFAPANNDAAAHQLLIIAKKYHLTLEYEIISYNRALYYSKLNSPSNAVYWANKAAIKGKSLIESIFTTVLSSHITTFSNDTLTLDSLLEQVNDSLAKELSIITFASHYRDMIDLANDIRQVKAKLQRDRNNSTAIFEELNELTSSLLKQLLYILIRFDATPRQFFIPLIQFLGKFLHSCSTNHIIVAANDLQRVLLLFTDLSKKSEKLAEMNQIRLQLTQALARSLPRQLTVAPQSI